MACKISHTKVWCRASTMTNTSHRSAISNKLKTITSKPTTAARTSSSSTHHSLSNNSSSHWCHPTQVHTTWSWSQRRRTYGQTHPTNRPTQVQLARRWHFHITMTNRPLEASLLLISILQRPHSSIKLKIRWWGTTRMVDKILKVNKKG